MLKVTIVYITTDVLNSIVKHVSKILIKILLNAGLVMMVIYYKMKNVLKMKNKFLFIFFNHWAMYLMFIEIK